MAVRLRLVDGEDAGRTSASLVASLGARLASLHAITGADAIGSLTAGYAALGRQIATTSEGARLLEAIRGSRAGTNGETLWTGLRIGDWASALSATPVLEQLRDDLALLAADDLDDALALPPTPAQVAGSAGAPAAEPATFAHYLLGMWAFAHAVLDGVDALTSATVAPERINRVPSPPATDGPLLR